MKTLIFALALMARLLNAADDMVAFSNEWKEKLAGEWTAANGEKIGFQGRIIVRGDEAVKFAITNHDGTALLSCFWKEAERFTLVINGSNLTMTPVEVSWGTGQAVITPTGATQSLKKTSALSTNNLL